MTSRQHPDCILLLSNIASALFWWHPDSTRTVSWCCPTLSCINLMTSRQHPYCIPILPTIASALFWWHPDSTQTVSWYCPTLSLHYSNDTQTAPGLYPDIVLHYSDDIQTAPRLYPDIAQHCPCIILMTSRQHPDCILILYNTVPALFWWHPDSTRTVSWYCTTLSLHYSDDIQTAPGLYPDITLHCPCIILMASRQHQDCIPILPTIASALFWWHPDSTRTVSWCCPTLSLHYSDDVQTAPQLYPDIAQHCPCIILMTSRQHPDCILILYNTFPALFWWHPDSTWTVSWYCPTLSCIILMKSRQHPDCILMLPNIVPALF